MKILNFFPRSGSYVRLQLQSASGENTWHNKLKLCFGEFNAECPAGRENTTAAPEQGSRDGAQAGPAPLGEWLLLPGTAAPSGAPAQHQTLSLEAAGAYYDTVLEADLIWGNQLISFSPCKTDWPGHCWETESQFPAHLSHTLPASTSCNPFFPTPGATITRNKLINKQLLFQTRPNFYYYFNFLQRICIGKFHA